MSGYLEKENTPYEQALEEIREETGLGEGDIELVKEGQPLEIIGENLRRRWVTHPYRFRASGPERIRIDWEHPELRWISPGDISKYETVPGLEQTWQRVA